MTRTLWTAAAALGLALGAAGAARADVADQVVDQLRAQGFTHVEVVRGPTQVKVEAIRGTQEVEYVYDLRTGELLSREVSRVRPGEDRTPRVEFDRSDEDFVDGDDHGGDDDDDDDMDDDGNNGHGNDDDGFDDSNPGRGHGDDGQVGGGRGHGGDDDDDDDGDDHGGRGHGNGKGHGGGDD